MVNGVYVGTDHTVNHLLRQGYYHVCGIILVTSHTRPGPTGLKPRCLHELCVERMKVAILRRVLHSMLSFLVDNPVSPTIPPRFRRSPDLFGVDGGILVLRPIGR